MKTSYHQEEDSWLAIVDLVDYSELAAKRFPDIRKIYLLARLSVPPAIRGRGLARKLLTDITTDADRAQVVLILHHHPYRGIDPQRLIRLYTQFGFESKTDGSMMRMPRPQNEYLLPSS